jgi:hypothetical protein
MTNFKQAKSNKKRGGNRKDGNGPDQRPTTAQQGIAEVQWMAAGFSRQWIRGAPRLTYTLEGDFPVFVLSPGMITDDQGTYEGLITRFSKFEILFPYGTHPANIAIRLNGLILAIMRHDARDDQPLNWQPAGEEIDIDLWMTQPETAKRMSTKAVQKFAKKNQVLLTVADEMMLERSQ